jgi:hypothetical protein
MMGVGGGTISTGPWACWRTWFDTLPRKAAMPVSPRVLGEPFRLCCSPLIYVGDVWGDWWRTSETCGAEHLDGEWLPNGDDTGGRVAIAQELPGRGDRGVGALGPVVGEQDGHGSSFG